MRQNVARWLAIMLLLFVPHAQAQATRSARPGRPPRSRQGATWPGRPDPRNSQSHHFWCVCL